MELVWTVVIGFLIGLVARALMPGPDNMGLIFTTLLGIVGALIAQFVGQALGLYVAGEPAGFISAVLGAMLLLFLARTLGRKGITT